MRRQHGRSTHHFLVRAEMDHVKLGIVFHMLMIFHCCQDISSNEQNSQTSTFEAEFGVTYNGSVSSNKAVQYTYSYNISDNKRTAVRISSWSNESNAESPLIVVIRRRRSVISWQIPLFLRYINEYRNVSRTLCPLDTNMKHMIHHDQKTFVELSTQSVLAAPYFLRAEILTDFSIGINEKKVLSSTPSNPVYYMFNFPQNMKTVVVTMISDSKLCSVLSIQNSKCPVFDLDKDVESRSSYQTVTEKGAITVDKSSFASFYVVVVVLPDDTDCSEAISTPIPPAQAFGKREKTFTLFIAESLPSSQYWRPIIAAIGVFLAFFFVAGFIGIYDHGCKTNGGFVVLSADQQGTSEDVAESNLETSPINQGKEARPRYHSVPGEGEPDHEMTNVLSGSSAGSNDNTDTDTQPINSGNSEEDHRSTSFSQHYQDQSQEILFVSDLSKKDENSKRKKYMLYFKNLITISIFYWLPVIQLVLNYQKIINLTGNHDICYYNSLCSHRLGPFIAFNNVFSNIGYVLLGTLFLILVYRREKLHIRNESSNQEGNNLFGIPQYFGLYYAMGFALCIEGVMSACYHICPTVQNFQFDTSFMYIMASLCILKIYQSRHPDITTEANSSYLVMAFIVTLVVFGVAWDTHLFWILFALVYMLVSFLFSIYLYHMERYKRARQLGQRRRDYAKENLFSLKKPRNLDKLILLAVGLAVNWGFAIYCFTNPKNEFATVLLMIFIANLLLYTFFYIVSKRRANEKLPNLTIALIVLSMIIWGFAVYFFEKHITNTQLLPASSRERNMNCIILQFYDSHDVWHFLSAMSLFFSFLVILTLDDEIMMIRRDQIPVF